MLSTTLQGHMTVSANATYLPARTFATARGMVWTRRVISTLIALFLLMDGSLRLVGFAPYVEGTVQAGYAVWLAPWIGLALLVSTLLYVIPRTAVLGAILVTGYLGGAVATQVRAEDPWFLFPFVFGVLAWGGLYLREPRLRALIPLRG